MSLTRLEETRTEFSVPRFRFVYSRTNEQDRIWPKYIWEARRTSGVSGNICLGGDVARARSFLLHRYVAKKRRDMSFDAICTYMKRILGEKRATREGLVISSTRLRERRGFLTLLIINCRNLAGYFDATYNQVAWEDIADEWSRERHRSTENRETFFFFDCLYEDLCCNTWMQHHRLFTMSLQQRTVS